MIKIIAKRLVREECIDDYLQMTKELVAASQAEPGCVTYTLNRITPASTSPASSRNWPNSLKSITR